MEDEMEETKEIRISDEDCATTPAKKFFMNSKDDGNQSHTTQSSASTQSIFFKSTQMTSNENHGQSLLKHEEDEDMAQSPVVHMKEENSRALMNSAKT
jgi:hypothetical protein